MNKEHTQYLLDNFPSLYRGYYKPFRETSMCWGFECGDGWFGLVRDLSARLEPCGVFAVQVKEKYGSLRFYTEPVPVEVADEVDRLIDEAEAKSEVICELCGEPGKLNDGGWLKVRCEKCWEE